MPQESDSSGLNEGEGGDSRTVEEELEPEENEYEQFRRANMKELSVRLQPVLDLANAL